MGLGGSWRGSGEDWTGGRWGTAGEQDGGGGLGAVPSPGVLDGTEVVRWHFRAASTGWDRAGGVGVEPGQGGRWRRRHTGLASPESCRGARGNTWFAGRLPGAGVTKGAPAAQSHPRLPPMTPSDRAETDGRGPAPISMTTPRKQTRRRDTLRTQEVERALPGQTPAVGGHCVPGRAGPILPRGDPGSPRPTPRAGLHSRIAPALPRVLGKGASQIKSSPRSFPWSLPEEGPRLCSQQPPTGRTTGISHPTPGALSEGGPGGALGSLSSPPNDPPTKEPRAGGREVGMWRVLSQPLLRACLPEPPLCLGCELGALGVPAPAPPTPRAGRPSLHILAAFQAPARYEETLPPTLGARTGQEEGGLALADTRSRPSTPGTRMAARGTVSRAPRLSCVWAHVLEGGPGTGLCHGPGRWELSLGARHTGSRLPMVLGTRGPE